MPRKQLTKNFSYDELKCKCGCERALFDQDFLTMLQDIRDRYGKPLTISSGYRCKSHNKTVGGAPRSLHMRGKAADIVWPKGGRERKILLCCAIAAGAKGLGISSKFLHIDNRTSSTLFTY